MNTMAAAAAVPENNFGFDNQPIEPNYLAWFILILLIAIFISMLLVVCKNMLTAKDNIKLHPNRYALWTSYPKTASTCSILIGLIGTLIGVYRTFIQTAIHSDDFEKAIGPVGEALVFLMLGLSIALVGYVMEFISRWKGIVASDDQIDT